MNNKKQLVELFARRGGIVERIGAKELFIIHFHTHALLYSYTTRVGIRLHEKWYLTLARYSATTTRQVNEFALSATCYEWLPQDRIDKLALEVAEKEHQL